MIYLLFGAAYLVGAVFIARYLSYYFCDFISLPCADCGHDSPHTHYNYNYDYVGHGGIQSWYECRLCNCRTYKTGKPPSDKVGWAIVGAFALSLVAWVFIASGWMLKSAGKKMEFQERFVKAPPRIETKDEKIARLEAANKELERENDKRLEALGVKA